MSSDIAAIDAASVAYEYKKEQEQKYYEVYYKKVQPAILAAASKGDTGVNITLGGNEYHTIKNKLTELGYKHNIATFAQSSFTDSVITISISWHDKYNQYASSQKMYKRLNYANQ
jgi:hypothetical protein